MAPSSPREDIEAWLRHGADLARARHGERAHCRHVIWLLFEEAIQTIEKVPDQERSWLTAGFRSGGWSQMVVTWEEIVDVEFHRLMAGMKPTDEGSPKTAPQRNDVDRALGVLEWLRFCTRGSNPVALQKAAVALARGGDVELVYRLYGSGRTRARQVVYEIRNRVIDGMLRGLCQSYGLVPHTGTAFRVRYAD